MPSTEYLIHVQTTIPHAEEQAIPSRALVLVGSAFGASAKLALAAWAAAKPDLAESVYEDYDPPQFVVVPKTHMHELAPKRETQPRLRF